MSELKPLSRRQKLDKFYGSGDLRYHLESKLDADALELLLDIVARYCSPPRRRRRRYK